MSKDFKLEFISEIRSSLPLVTSLVITQLLEAGVPLVDGIMMGLLNSQTLAAGALAAVTFSTVVSVCRSILSAAGSRVANAFGAGELDQVNRVIGQGIWLAGLTSLVVMVIVWHFDFILLLTGQEPSNILLAKTYFHAIVWGVPAALGFCILKEVSSALNRPQFLTVIAVTGLLLNIGANYVFMFGKLGFPALGLAGIGWASTLVLWVNFVAAGVWIRWDDHFRNYHFDRAWKQFDREMFIDIFQTGWYLGLQYGAEAGVFTAIALVMGFFGTNTLAAHEIAFEAETLVEMVAIGSSYAIMMRVGQLSGQKDFNGAFRAGLIGIGFMMPIVSVGSLFFWLFPDWIEGVFLDMHNPDNIEVIHSATLFLSVGAILQLFYSIQTIAAGALIGLKDTKLPMLIITFAYWGVGLGGGCFMAIPLGWGPVGLWVSLTLGLFIAAVLLCWRFYRLTIHAELSSPPLRNELLEDG